MYKYGDRVKVTKGFYKDQSGLVIGDDDVSVNGMIGEESGRVYRVVILLGKAIVNIEEKDLQLESQEKIETGEDIENKIEDEAEVENPEEVEEDIENKGEKDPKEK